MIQLNLLPNVKKEFISAQRTRNRVVTFCIIATIAAGAVTFLLATIVYGGQQALITLKNEDIKKNQAALEAKPEIDKYLTVQNQLSNIQTLHDDRYLYSRAFTFLQDLNPAAPNNVALASVIISRDENTLEIEGTARNFQALSVFKTTLENAEVNYRLDDEAKTMKLFEKVDLLEAGLAIVNNVSLTSFKISLIYPQDVFLSAATDVKTVIPDLVTSDGDRNTPRQVFGDVPEGVQ